MNGLPSPSESSKDMHQHGYSKQQVGTAQVYLWLPSTATYQIIFETFDSCSNSRGMMYPVLDGNPLLPEGWII